MTESIIANANINKAHTIYGGKIEIEDFNSSIPNKNRINNQAKAQILETNLLTKKIQKQKYLSYNIEELRKKKLVSNTNGRPSPTLTNEKWQREFQIRKLFINPYSKEIKNLKSYYSKESGTWNYETQETYSGCTNWQSYCSFINDILKNIRSGQVDYCYYIYQIMELSKFHYNKLETKYCDGYWEVWLKK